MVDAVVDHLDPFGRRDPVVDELRLREVRDGEDPAMPPPGLAQDETVPGAERARIGFGRDEYLRVVDHRHRIAGRDRREVAQAEDQAAMRRARQIDLFPQLPAPLAGRAQRDRRQRCGQGRSRRNERLESGKAVARNPVDRAQQFMPDAMHAGRPFGNELPVDDDLRWFHAQAVTPVYPRSSIPPAHLT